MKPVLNWIKSNLVAVICVAVVLIALPLAWFFSSKWNKSIREAREAEAGREFQAVNAARVEYALPSYEPGAEPVTLNTEPNDALTRWFKSRRDELRSQADALVQRVIAFNKGEGADAQAVGRRPHKPLIEGLFPSPTGDATEMFYMMEDALLGKRGRPNPYEQLLSRINAGGPPDPARVAEAVENVRAREFEKIGARQPTEEEQAEIRKRLMERRIAEYQARARDISVYATLASFESDQKRGAAIPTESLLGLYSREPARVRPLRFFSWQWDLWAYTDLLEAVRVANRGPGGEQLSVNRAPVKRIEYVTVRDVEGLFAADSETPPDPMGMAGGAPAGPTPEVPGMLPTDPTVSVTGRAGGEWNKLYDVRRAQMRLIVDSKRLPEVVRAISATNLMTVTDMDVEQIDVWEHLRDGYAYGSDHVVRVILDVETLWLRDWTTPLMPPLLRDTLGIQPENADPNALPPG